MATSTHTRTHIVITPANPYLICETCGERVEAFHDDRCGCGCGESGPVNLPCGDYGDYIDMCPSWSPVDGCQCLEHLGYIPHPEILALTHE